MEEENNQLSLLKAKLVKIIVEEEFGEECAIICETFVKRQKMSLPQISEALKSQLSDKSIKYLMIVLIKNGLINYEQSGNTNYYFVLIQNVLSFMRGPSYLKHVKILYGTEAESIIEFFLNNAQGSFDDYWQHYQADKMKQGFQEKKEKQVKEKQKEAFLTLIKGNYLQRFESNSSQIENRDNLQELVQPPQQEEKINKKRKRGEDEQPPKRKAIKKSIIDDDDSLLNNVSENLNTKEKNTDNPGDEYLLIDPISKEGLIYRINTRQFIHDFRSEEIGKLAEGKLNIQARQIIRAMLDTSQKIGRAHDIKTSEFLSLEQVKSLLVKSGGKDALAIKEEFLQKMLRLMKRDGGKFIEIDFINGKEVYAVNLDKIMTKMKIRHITKIIERKYDLIAGRIFRILKKHKQLEEKAISEISLQSRKDAQKYLNKLSTDGYIEYVEIKEKDKTVSVMNMFKYNQKEVMARTIEQYYQVLINLKTRLNVAYKRERDLEEQKKICPDDSTLKNQQQSIIKMIMNLEIGVMELDLSLLAFSEF